METFGGVSLFNTSTKQEVVFEFCELSSIHSSKNMAPVVFQTLQDLNIQRKLLAIYSDSVSNNTTLIEHLHRVLQTPSTMRFEVGPGITILKSISLHMPPYTEA